MNRPPLARRAGPRRAVAAALAAAALAAAPAAHAQAPVAPDWRVATALGFELGMGDEDYGTVKVRVEAERAVRELSPRARLGAVLSLGLSHPSGKESVPIAFDPLLGIQTADLTWDANVFELVPSARLVYDAAPRVSFFGDGGLGIAYTTARATLPVALEGLGLDALVDDGVAGVLRLAAGVLWTPTPSLRVGLEAVGLHLRFGGGVGSAFNLVASVSHRL